ncbi:MAG: TIGR03790 family protein, partial [Deltaproteobacteria bacterium]|nr:TIGR03790 family protein [Deltaproteobacteria bacterium]
LIFLCALLAGLLVPSGAWALSALDLVIVFNRNLPESREVAVYYAGKRRVPADNLVGVDVPTSEDMSRQDYDGKLVRPVKAMVDKLRARGITPAILLVYGLPLRVGAAPLTVPEMELKSLATAKVKEYQSQAVQLVHQLDRLTGALTSPPGLTYPTSKLLEKSRDSLVRGQEYLDKQPATPATEATRAEITSLVIKLGGTSPEARALMARMARERSPRRGLRPRELLGSPPISPEDMEERAFHGILPNTAQETATAIRDANGLLGELKFWYEAQQLYGKPQTMAAVDSELTLIMAGPYQKAGWLPNPFNLRFERLPAISQVRAKTLMVGRLDGPTPATARRLVDDALEVERTGLSGVFYLDARGLTGQANPGNYAWFDQHLLHLSDLLKKYSEMKVVLDKQPGLFPPGSCPDAALYCGWYSVSNYVPAFKWNQGAVGYHVASSEATTLKKPGANVWCKRMLEEGVAATLGPVAEPYLFSFPLPDQFFPLLMTGKLTLLEVYFLTVPQVSWMQLLIGDPLYQPFKDHPAFRPPSITPEAAPEPK